MKNAMNLFLLSWDPMECAQWHCDKHVVKMILELVQMLYTGWQINNDTTNLPESAPLCKSTGQHGYKKAHPNHPMTKWVRESKWNYNFTLKLAAVLALEYAYRYENKRHACTKHIIWLSQNLPKFSNRRKTVIPQCMPDEYKCDECPIMAYRNYYIHEKNGFAKWYKREVPFWYKQMPKNIGTGAAGGSNANKSDLPFEKDTLVTLRPTIGRIKTKFEDEIKGKIIQLPKTKNKGLPGQNLEKLLDIPTSTATLDCSDGELKLFPLKKLKNGKYVPKETIAITMSGLNPKNIQNPASWESSSLHKKTSNMLFISYFRENDTIVYMDSYSFNKSNQEFHSFKSDYEKITQHYQTNGIRNKGNTISGTYIQGRTKGPGGDKRSVAFYFRSKQFVQDILLKI